MSRNKSEFFEESIKQIRALVEGEENQTANFANVSAVLIGGPNIHWAGFYLVENDELVLGPFQGPVACTRIGFGKGVCGSSWKENRLINVPDVEDFPGHIACSSFSKSEIVVPVEDAQGNIIGVLDIDSDVKENFDKEDEEFYKSVVATLVK